MRVAITQETLATAGHAYSVDVIEAAFARANDELSSIHARGLDITAQGRTVLHMRHLDESLGDRLEEATWEQLHRIVLTAARLAPPPPMPGGLDALRAVRELRLPIGLVSNAGATPGYVLREILDGYGLLEHFDDMVFSDEVELSKPSPAIFERALAPFGVAPDEAVFVGDQPILDVQGPRDAGLWTVQLGDLTHDGIEPHARIAHLGELVPAFRVLGLIDGPVAAAAPKL
jgi:putative hydrolase of the HAD superfamily